MTESLREWMLWFLRVPPEPLDPMGDVQTLRVFRAAPGYFSYRVLLWSLKQVIGLAGLLFVLVPVFMGAASAGPAAFLIIAGELVVLCFYPIAMFFSYQLLRLDYEVRWYKVTDRSLRIREGVLNIREMTMTYANIQNILIAQGPLQRLFGISDVRVESAGGMSVPTQGEQGGASLHMAVFRGVDNPEEIRDLMLSHLRHLRGTGLGDPDEPIHTVDPSPPAVQEGAAPDLLLELLRELHAEARALRTSAQTLHAAGIRRD